MLGYEAVDFLFNDAQWMHNLLQSNYVELFNFLLTTEFNTLKAIFSDSKDKLDLAGEKTEYPKMFFKNTLEFPPCEFSFSAETKMIIKNFEIVAYSLYAIYVDILKLKLETRL